MPRPLDDDDLTFDPKTLTKKPPKFADITATTVPGDSEDESVETDSRWEINHVDHLQTALRIAGADVSHEGVHVCRTELLQQDDRTLAEWHGKLAEEFGLAGARKRGTLCAARGRPAPLIPPSSLYVIASSRSTEARMGRQSRRVEHRAGWDATFSAPKSVSLTALVGGDDRVRDAHREAVNVALSELERYTQARIGGNHAAETTGAFIAAKFEHDTARPVDGYAAPQLHTHAVIFNVAVRDNGQTRALQERGLFESQQFATAVYQSELTYRLRNLGYEIEPGRSGAPEIKGYSQEYLDASSPRSQQIREHTGKGPAIRGRRPRRSPRTPPATARKFTRPQRYWPLIDRSPVEFRQPGRQSCDGSAEGVVRNMRSRMTRESSQQVARQAVTYARDRSFEREAVTDERELYRDALRRGDE